MRINTTTIRTVNLGVVGASVPHMDAGAADVETRLSAATFLLCCSHPYLASALWAMTRVAAPGIDTLAVDAQWRLYYDPAAVARWTVAELSAVVYHEACHLLRDHAGRRPPDTDQLAWNLCADAEINDGLRDEEQPLPDGLVYPSTLGAPDGLLAEQYLPFLKKRGRSQSQGIVPQTGPCGGRCGSGAGGPPGEWELGDAGNTPGIAPAEAELVRRQTAHAVKEHDRTCGTVPGDWLRWADARLEPRTDWRRELAALVRLSLAEVAGATDYSYRRPSRRQSCLGSAVAPSLRRPVPRVAVVVDTSGSITDGLLETALAEVSGVLRAAGQREGATVLAVDAAVQSSRRVSRADQVSLTGGGGTDMRVGLEAARALRPRPDIVVVITDGLTPWPETPPRGLRTVVVLTGAGRGDRPWAAPAWDGVAPAWARVIRLPQDAG